MIVSSTTGCWDRTPPGPVFFARLTIEGQPADLTALQLWGTPGPVASYGVGENLGIPSVDVIAPDLDDDLGNGVVFFSAYATPGRGGAGGPYAWWIKVEGFVPVLLGPFSETGTIEAPTLQAELVPSAAPETCWERFGPGDLSLVTPCDFDLRFSATEGAPPEVLVAWHMGWPEANAGEPPPPDGPLTGRMITGPTLVTNIWTAVSDGITNYATFIATAPGYLPDVKCVPCGGEAAFTLVPHGLEPPPAACNVASTRVEPATPWAATRIRVAPLAAFAALIVLGLILRARRRAVRSWTRP